MSGFIFENLDVYKKSLNLLDEIYKIANTFPDSEKFNLTSQFIRATTSIALNIAEGAEDSSKEFNRYLNISKASLRESVVCLEIAKRRSYIDDATYLQIRNDFIEISKMLTGLIKAIIKKSNN